MALPGVGAAPAAAAAAAAAAGGNWTPGVEMPMARQGPGAALLRSGVVLVAGGRTSAAQSAATSSAVRFISWGSSKPWRPAGQVRSQPSCATRDPPHDVALTVLHVSRCSSLGSTSAWQRSLTARRLQLAGLRLTTAHRSARRSCTSQ
jgi:hypothetical protein